MGRDYNARRAVAKPQVQADIFVREPPKRGDNIYRRRRRDRSAEGAEKTKATAPAGTAGRRYRWRCCELAWTEMADLSVGGLRPFTILVVEVAMFVVRAGELAFDEEIAHLRLELEGVAVGYDDVGEFSWLQGA
jgi:hypothetical protein